MNPLFALGLPHGAEWIYLLGLLLIPFLLLAVLALMVLKLVLQIRALRRK